MGSLTMDEPEAVHWSYNDVINWIKDLGYPQYAECFSSNFIDGKRLILMNGSTLPNIGIQDYEHIKAISHDIKANILKIESDQWNRSISVESITQSYVYIFLWGTIQNGTRGLHYILHTNQIKGKRERERESHQIRRQL